MIRSLTFAQAQQHPAWEKSFADQRKDHRYYEIVETTLDQGFTHGYFLIEDDGRQAIQPYFILDQDLFQGAGPKLIKMAERLRRKFPRFAKMRTMMVGCAAGEGHLDARGEVGLWIGMQLAQHLKDVARQMRCAMVVLKEFPLEYRSDLIDLQHAGYFRMPSLPMVTLNIHFPDFETYMQQSLSKATRKNLRRKFKATAGKQIDLQVVNDIAPYIDEAYPLYVAVYDRSPLHFEKLTKTFLCRLGQEMPETVRYFLWHMNGKLIAFSLCMIKGDTLYDEYLGLDYAVALDLHLYFHTLRDIISWAMTNGYNTYCSSALNYEPKLHLKCTLAGIDLYVAHTSDIANFFLGKILPLVAPTNSEKVLARFPNYDQLWGEP